MAWVVLREAGFDVRPYHMVVCPELRFIEASVAYYERVFDTRIPILWHPSFPHFLNHSHAQPPWSLNVLDATRLDRPGYKDTRNWACDTWGVPRGTWCAVGTRISDSPLRRLKLSSRAGHMSAVVNLKSKTFSPIFDANKDEIVATLKRAGVKVPYDYHVWGRSFDGLDYRYLKGLREVFPEDYATVLKFFPALDAEFARVEFGRKHGRVS